jgi:hypothetical protein
LVIIIIYIETVYMTKILIVLILALLFSVTESRRMRGTTRGVARTGAVLGGGVATLIKDLREKPQMMPKGYKR